MKFEYMMETEKILPYYQFPKFLLELPLSQNAKILYMLLYDRGGTLDRRDIELLIERIDVDKEGMPEITLKYGLSDLINYSPADEMNRRENTVIALVMKLIIEDERGYTSAKYLSEHITALGFKKTKQSILPYINLMKELGILEDTDNPLKPYNIVKTKKEIMILMHQYLPDLPAQMTSKQLSDNYLHYYGGNRRYAGNGI